LEFTSIDELQSAMREKRYIAEHGLATSLYLALKLHRPLFLEGEAGVGKTEVAKIMANLLDTDLIRLQCYEGLDVHHAVYEWNYTRQMMHIRFLEAQGERASEAELFGEEFLLRRPLLQAIEKSKQKPPVLLIDELDRSD
jgi:MoxR-like ATPase